jgi:hypothetical protein
MQLQTPGTNLLATTASGHGEDEIKGMAVSEALAAVLEDGQRCGGLCRAVEPQREEEDDRLLSGGSRLSARYQIGIQAGPFGGLACWASAR